MANTLKFGSGQWATKVGSTLAYNDEGGNFKPLPFNFTRSTSATRVNKDGLIEVVTNNKPRIDFLNDSNGALLLEPTRTNLITYSEDFTHPNWNKESGVIITPNYGISPDGTQNSTRLQLNSINKSIYFVTGLGYASLFSIYIKGTKGEVIRVSNTGGTLHTFTGEWDRVECYDSGGTSPNVSVNSYGGSTTALDMEIWGAQLEAGSYATSYIPTQGATATRVDESCNGAGNDQVINSTEGVFYVEISALANDGEFKIVSFKNSATNTYANTINITYSSTANQIIAVYRVGTSSVVVLSKTLNNAIDFNKVAFKYKSGDFALWINGVKEGVNSNTTMISGVTLDEVTFYRSDNSSRFFGKTKDLRVYNTALTDQELINLTTI
jgi:hypothetical protein